MKKKNSLCVCMRARYNLAYFGELVLAFVDATADDDAVTVFLALPSSTCKKQTKTQDTIRM